MNSKTQSPTRSEPALSNDRAGNDTKSLQKFEVVFSLNEISWAKQFIEASSISEAEAKAKAIRPQEITKWNCCEYAFEVHSVDLAKGDLENA
jgi:hypothetical protein